MTIIDELAEYFRKMPGIGPRQAKRIVLYLLRQDSGILKNFTDKISELKRDIRKCNTCNKFFSSKEPIPECEICRDKNRSNKQVVVVASDTDLENVEKSRVYDGKYYILGGYMTINNEADYDRFVSDRFINFLNSRTELEEIIFALSATPDADYTCDHLTKKIKEKISGADKIKISKLGRGLSTGSEIEYSDSNTIENAFRNRI